MTGQNKRKNRSSQGEAIQNVTSSRNKTASRNNRSSQTEVEELKRKISGLESKNRELTRQNESLRDQLQSLNDDNESQAEVVSDDSTRPAKRQMRKKPSDEEEKAKSIIKTLLKTFPELELREKDTFRSKKNDDICQQLIPKLQKEIKTLKYLKYDPSSDQVMAWLQSIHRTKRSAYLKLKQSNQDDEDNGQETESDGAIQSAKSAKRQTKSKVRKSDNLTEDDDGLKNEEGSKIEEGAKTLMRKLLDKTYTQDEYKLKFQCTFRDQVNTDICKQLIPRLLEDVKAFNLSHNQVETWLQTYHKSKRNNYLKSNQMDIDQY